MKEMTLEEFYSLLREEINNLLTECLVDSVCPILEKILFAHSSRLTEDSFRNVVLFSKLRSIFKVESNIYEENAWLS